MNIALRVRLLLDFLAVGLIVLCLAYWWLDNLSHEFFGTALFVLVFAHNVLNRRWYGALPRTRRDPLRLFNITSIVCVGMAMLVMLVTSLMISRDLFSFLALDAAFSVREIHMFAAYWLLLLVAVHLGTRWEVVMAVFRSAFRLKTPNADRTTVLRVLAVAVAAWGVRSSFEIGFGSKLMLRYSLDM